MSSSALAQNHSEFCKIVAIVVFCCYSWFLDYFVRTPLSYEKMFSACIQNNSYFIFQRERKTGLENSLYGYTSVNNSFSLRIKAVENNVFQENTSFFSLWGSLAGKWAGAVLKCSLFPIFYMTTTIHAAIWKKAFRPVIVHTAWHISS